MRIGLFFQGGNFIGPEYFRALRTTAHEIVPVVMGVMSYESRGREIDRTGGLWNPNPIMEAVDFSEWGGDAIRELAQFDYAVNGGVGFKITGDILRAPKRGWINVHPGLLPAFRGSSCPEWAVLVGENVYATAHMMDEGLDTGPIICSERYSFDPEWNYHQFRANLYPHCANVLLRALKLLEGGKAPVEQVGFGVTWPKMPDQILERVKRQFFPFHPSIM